MSTQVLDMAVFEPWFLTLHDPQECVEVIIQKERTRGSQFKRAGKWLETLHHCHDSLRKLKKIQPSSFYALNFDGLKVGLASESTGEVLTTRNILIEIDELPLAEQVKIVRGSGMPYSSAVFSGNRSIHWVVSLEQHISFKQQEQVHRQLCAIMGGAPDHKTHRSNEVTRAPGCYRQREEDGLYSNQVLYKLNGRVPNQVFFDWLESKKDLYGESDKTANRESMKRQLGLGSSRLYANYKSRLLEKYLIASDKSIEVGAKYSMPCPCCRANGADRKGSNFSVEIKSDDIVAYCHKDCNFSEIIKLIKDEV